MVHIVMLFDELKDNKELLERFPNLFKGYTPFRPNDVPGEGLHIKGKFTIDKYTNDRLVDRRVVDNLITNTGFDFIANAIGGIASKPADTTHYTAIGVDNTAASTNQTTLISELTAASNAFVHTAGTLTYDAVASFGPGVSGAVVEACLRDTLSSGVGNMLNRQAFTAVNVTSGDTLQVKYTITLS